MKAFSAELLTGGLNILLWAMAGKLRPSFYEEIKEK